MEGNMMRVVEINGVKVEVDLRTAKVVENYKVGNPVKILVKQPYAAIEVFPGVIIGFDDFKDLPTICVAYLKTSYSAAEVCFAYINTKTSENYMIAPLAKIDRIIEKGDALDLLDRAINAEKEKVADLEAKKRYFLVNFDQYFQELRV